MPKSTENVNFKGSWLSWETKYVSSENLGQNFMDKFRKFSKINFNRECFAANFWAFSSKIVKIFLMGDPLDAFLQFLKTGML